MKRAGLVEPILLALVLAGGLGARLAYLAELRSTPEYRFPDMDAAYHDYWARGIATGRWLVTGGREDPRIYLHPYYRPPAYPYFLAALYALFGTGPLAPRLVQMGLGLGGVVLGRRLGRRWFGPLGGLYAAAGLAFFWALVYFEGELVGVSLTVFLSLLLLTALDRAGEGARPSPAAAAGAVLGLLLLLRPNLALTLPFFLVWLGRRVPSPRRPAVLGLFLGALAVPVAITAARNLIVAGEFVPISTNAGVSVAVANNAETDGTTHVIPGLGDVGSPFDWPRMVRAMERERGLPPGGLSHRRASAILVAQGRDWALAHPLDFLALLGRKALLFWGPNEIRNVREVHYARLFSPLLSLLPGGFPALAAIGLAGLVLAVAGAAGERGKRGGALAGIYLLVSFLSLLPFAAAARYRVPTVPALLLLGGACPAAVRSWARARRWKPAACTVLAVAVLWRLLAANWTGYRPSPEKWHYDRALAWTDARDYGRAAAEFREAIRCLPDFLRAYNNLGNIYMLTGKFSEAVPYYRYVLERRPEMAQTRANLGNAVYNLSLSEPDEERASAMVEEDVGHYLAALALQPDLVEAWNNLGVARARQGDLQGALEAYGRALEYRPGNISTLMNMGEAYRRLGQSARARDCYREVLRLEPGFAAARERLSRIEAGDRP